MDSSKWLLCSIAMCWVSAVCKVSAFNTFSDALEDLEDNVGKLQTMLEEMEMNKRYADNGKCESIPPAKWNMDFKLEYTPRIRITRDGFDLKISLLNKANNKVLHTVNLEKVNDGVFKGKLVAKGLYRPATWEFYSLEQGKLMVESFCGDGCGNKYKNDKYDKYDEYCCDGVGVRKGGNTDDIEGTWDQAFNNIRFSETWETSNGKVGPLGTQANPKGLVNLEPSDSPIFPKSDCWLMSRGTYRDATTEFYRLVNGKLEIRSFCTDGCDNVYMGEKGYCCGGEGVVQKVVVSK